jgi:hypothetical protein
LKETNQRNMCCSQLSIPNSSMPIGKNQTKLRNDLFFAE